MPELSNNPPITVELTHEMATFILENCHSNIIFGLAALKDTRSPDLSRKLVFMIENFKKLRELVETARNISCKT